MELIDAGDAAHHVFEPWFVGLIVGHEFDRRRAAGALFDQLGESFDGDFFGVANVHDLADGPVGVHQANEAFNGVADVAEAAGLLTVAIDLDGLAVECLLDEIGQDHAVTTGLARTYGVEQADHDDGELFFFPIGEREKFIESFGGGVAPTAFGGGAEDKVGVFVERDVGVLAVDFGSGGGEDEFAFLAGGFEDALSAVDIGFNGTHGAFHDELDADSGGKVDDDVGIVHEFCEELKVFDVIEMIFHLAGSLKMANVIHASGGEVVEQNDTIAAGEKPLCQMRTDEAGAAGDQITQSASLQYLFVVAMARGAFGDGLWTLILVMQSITRFLRVIAVRIRIVAIRIVVVWRAGIHCIQDDAEDMALHTDKQVAGAREGLLGRFATAHDQQDAIGLDRQNDSVGGGHDGRRVDYNELELGAQFGDGLGQFL